MCGLIGFIGKKDVDPEISQEFILDQFDEQHNRGSKGFGLIKIDKNSLKIKRATQEMKALIDVSRAEAQALFFHHRLPTSTENTQDQTHPIKVSHAELSGDWYVQHNGVISNDNLLKTIHQNDLGYAYTTLTKEYPSMYSTAPIEKFNDSEAFAIELARYLEGLSHEIGTFGNAAFLAVKTDKKTGLVTDFYWGRNDGSNKLFVDETPAGIVIASELPAGENVTNFVAEHLEAKYVFAKKQPKKLLSKIESLGLVFAEKPETPIKTTKVLGFKTHSNMPNTNPSSSVTPKDTAIKTKTEELPRGSILPKTPPNGYTPREWALAKLGLRNNGTLDQKFLEFFDNIAYLDQEGTDLAYDFIVEDIADFIFELTSRAQDIKNRFESIEDEESRLDYEEEMAAIADEHKPTPADYEDTNYDPYARETPSKYSLS